MGSINKFALGMNKGGRPPMFETPEQMEQKINEYFDSMVNEDGEFIGHPTVTGLTLFLGFADKKSLREYKAKEGFTPLIKRALTVVEKNYEEMLVSRSPAGAIFALKNMGWEDKQEIRQHNVFEELTDSQIGTRIERLIQHRVNKPTE